MTSPRTRTAPTSVPFLTLKETAQHTKASEKTLRRMIARGELKAYKFGRQIRIKPADIEKALKPVTSLASIVEIDAELAGGVR